MNLKFVCAQPAIKYYTWQVEVMIDNFLSHGINPSDIHILCAYYEPEIPSDWKKLSDKYEGVRFFFFRDTREDRSYIPSIYFNLMRQYLIANPESQTIPLFLHDCDIIFTRLPDFQPMLRDKVWYLSDTVGYIGTQYILTKGEDVYLNMCKIMGMDPLIPKLLNGQSGGAQYLVKNTTPEFWEKVEKDAVVLYKHFCETEKDYKGEGYPIQKWTAGMWSLLWNAWLSEHETRVDKRLDFCWATDPTSRWDEAPIFHNAGVTADRTELFFKGEYINKYPFDVELEKYSNKHCSYKYVQELLKTKQTSCLI